jgi:hypothetical protein
MKVKDLIADLQKLNPEHDVSISVYYGCGGYEDTYQIFDTDEYPADKHGSGSAFVCVDRGCMCHQGTRTSKLTNRPQSISNYWRGLEAASEKIRSNLFSYKGWLDLVKEPKNYKEDQEKMRYEQAIRALENVQKDIVRLQRDSEPEVK